MTVLSNVTANVSESENVAFHAPVWLNGIVEAFDDGSCKLPIRTADRFHPLHFNPGNSEVGRDNGDVFYNSWLSYDTDPKRVPIMRSSSRRPRPF